MVDSLESVADMLPYWPGFFSEPSFLDSIYVRNQQVTITEGALSMSGSLVFDHDINFDLLQIPNVQLSINAGDNNGDIPIAVSLRPAFLLEVGGLTAKLAIKQKFLKAMKQEAGAWVEDLETNNEPKPLVVTVTGGAFSYDGNGGIELDTSASVTVTPFQIGNTGLVVQATGITLHLSENTSPTTIAPPGFRGVSIDSATIDLPESWRINDTDSTARLKAEKVLIGNGGLSGTFRLEPKVAGTPNPILSATIGESFVLGLHTFEVSFLQNAIVRSNIQGTLKIPGFKAADGSDATVDVQVQITDDGLRIAASSRKQLATINILSVLTFQPRSLGFGYRGDDVFIELGGLLDITAEIPGAGGRFLDGPIDIKKLVIWSNGEIDFEAGTIPLPKIKPLKVGPVEVSVAALHIGSYKQQWGGHDRRYKYIGFDAGVKTGLGGVDAHGQGIKFYFTVDNTTEKPLHTFLRIDGIRIHLMIPGNATKDTADVIFDGYITAKNRENSQPPQLQPGELSPTPNPETEYTGGVDFALPKVGLSGGADLRMIPSTGAFLADIHLDLPRGIPIANTGLGIYGFRGTVANKYVLEKPEKESWWDFYKKPERGVHAEKFTPRDGFSVGAGATIGTTADSGYSFSAKIYFMLSIPTAFLLEGQAAVMHRRLGLETEDDPPFFAAIILDFQKGGITAGIGAHIELPDGGDVLDINADMEVAFYMGRTDLWHLYIGQEAKDKRVQGTFLRLMNCWAYFMLSASGIKAGAGVEWSAKVDCGIASVGLGASMEATGFVNFRPIQLGGRIALSGYAELRLFGIGFRLEARASLEAEAPKPFIIRGGFTVTLDLPWPIPNVDLTVYLAWHFNDELPKTEVGFLAPPHPKELSDQMMSQFIQSFGLDDYKELGTYPVKAIHMITREPFLLNAVKREYIPREPNGVPSYPALPPNPELDRAESAPTPGMGEWIGDFRTFTVPVDSYIDIEFNKHVKPINPDDDPNGDHASMGRIGLIQGGLHFTDLVPPERGASNQVEHQYLLDNVRILFWDEAAETWRDYDMPAYNTPLRRLLSLENLQRYLKVGEWQLTQSGEYTKLRILARTPFDQNETLPPVDAGFPPTAVFCPDTGIELTCQNWDEDDLPQFYQPAIRVDDRRLDFVISNDPGEVVPYSRFGLNRSLKLKRGNSIEIFLPEASRQIDLRFTTESDRVVVSYYRGQAWAPPSSPPSVNGTTVGWRMTPPASPSLAPRDGTWEMLMAFPAFVRTFCTGTGAPLASTATTSLRALVDQKYFLTDVYLKQNNHEAELAADADICAKLRSMLRTVLIGKTGSTPIQRRLLVNVEHFYQDVKRYAADYSNELGEPAIGALAVANDYYEKWRGLITCLGKLCDTRNALPAGRNDLRERTARLVDPAISRLYRKLNDANWYGQPINPRTWLGGACDQLTSIAGFISAISLDLGSATMLDIMTALEPYYNRLERAYLRVARGLGRNDAPNCGVDRCGAAEMVALVRTLCVDPQVSGTTLTAITTLVSGFESATLPTLHTHLGWLPPSVPGSTLCDRLRRVLPAVIVAYGAFDELPFALRWKVRSFREELIRLVGRYREETLYAPKGTPVADTDSFAVEWSAMLSCLCALCAESGLPEESYLQSAIDPQLKAAYDVLSDALVDGMAAATPVRRPMYGTRIPGDSCDRVSDLFGFFTAALARSGEMDADMRGRLDARYTPFMSDFQTLANTLAGSTFCGGVLTDTLNCQAWPGLLECVRAWRLREGEMQRTIRTAIDTTLAPLVQSLYMKLMGFQNASQITVPSEFEPMVYELDALIHYFRQYCLQGNDVPLQGPMQSDLASLQTAATAIVFHPDFVNADACETSGVDSCDRRFELVTLYAKLCGNPPSNPGPDWPTATINTLLDGFATNANEVAALLGMGSISFTRDAGRTFCDVFGDVVRLLVVAYGSLDELPLRYLPAIRGFVDAMNDAVALGGFNFPVFPSPSAKATCMNWLDVLTCVCTSCRYRDELQFFPDAEAAFNAVMGHLEQVYADALVIADAMDLEFLPYRAMSGRCGRLRVLANYIAAASLDYTTLPDTIALITNRSAFESAYDNAALDGARGRICDPAPGPYDPLRKRVVVQRDANGNLVHYKEGDEPIDRIVIEPLDECPPLAACLTYIHSVCWLSDVDFNYNAGLPPYEVQLQAGQDRAFALKNLTQPIWRPNTMYALQIETREVVTEKDGDKNVGGSVTYRRSYTFGFRTAGPVGHYHAETEYNAQTEQQTTRLRPEYQNLLDQDREGEYRYTGLKSYINRDKSYPDPDGNLVDAKPLYYENAKLSLVYDADYIDSMFSNWAAAAGLPEVHARLQTVIRDAGGSDIVIDAGWADDDHPTVRSGMRTFRNMMTNMQIDGKDCLQFDPIDQDRPVRRTEVSTSTLLKSRTLYTAVFNAIYQANGWPVEAAREVHRYVFSTSRYKDFAEHINSFYLDAPVNTRKGVTVHEIDPETTALSSAALFLSTPNDPSLAALARDYPEPYDLMVNGLLQVRELTPPERTEVTVLRKGTRVVGFLVRSPEPFNHPKIPRATMGGEKGVNDTFGVTLANPGSSASILFSKDLSAMFVTNAALDVQPGSAVTLNFTNLTFSGVAYAAGATVTLTFTIPT